jgi:hypothetical protein
VIIKSESLATGKVPFFLLAFLLQAQRLNQGEEKICAAKAALLDKEKEQQKKKQEY